MIAISALFQRGGVAILPSLHPRDKRFLYPVDRKVHVIMILLRSESKMIFFLPRNSIAVWAVVRQNSSAIIASRHVPRVVSSHLQHMFQPK